MLSPLFQIGLSNKKFSYKYHVQTLHKFLSLLSARFIHSAGLFAHKRFELRNKKE